MLVADADEAAVETWYREMLESDGWAPTAFGYIGMMDGRFTQHAWRRGELVIGLGFPDRDRLRQSYPAGTLHELTITHQPEDG